VHEHVFTRRNMCHHQIPAPPPLASDEGGKPGDEKLPALLDSEGEGEDQPPPLVDSDDDVSTNCTDREGIKYLHEYIEKEEKTSW